MARIRVVLADGSFAQILRGYGEKHYNTQAGTIRQTISYEANGDFRFQRELRNSSQLKRWEDEPDAFRRAAAQAERLRQSMRHQGAQIDPAVAGALWYQFASRDVGDADVFFDLLISGEGLEKGDAILALRRCLQRYARKGVRKSDARSNYEAAVTIKAWNFWHNGVDIRVLNWLEGERFPRIGLLRELDEAVGLTRKITRR